MLIEQARYTNFIKHKHSLHTLVILLNWLIDRGTNQTLSNWLSKRLAPILVIKTVLAINKKFYLKPQKTRPNSWLDGHDRHSLALEGPALTLSTTLVVPALLSNRE